MGSTTARLQGTLIALCWSRDGPRCLLSDLDRELRQVAAALDHPLNVLADEGALDAHNVRHRPALQKIVHTIQVSQQAILVESKPFQCNRPGAANEDPVRSDNSLKPLGVLVHQVWCLSYWAAHELNRAADRKASGLGCCTHPLLHSLVLRL